MSVQINTVNVSLYFSYEISICTDKLLLAVTCTTGEAESVDLQISDPAAGKHLSVLMQWSGYSQGPGMNLLSVQ